MGLAGIVLVFVLALVVGMNLSGGEDQASTGDEPGASAPEGGTDPEEPAAPPAPDEGAEATTTEPPPDEPDVERPDGVPDDWALFSDGSGRYTLWRPPSWAPSDGPGSGADFTDPATGDYLRVDFVSEPGEDPVEGWEQASARFADRYDDYEEIGIDGAEYLGFDAARWEYTYEGQHATNLGVVAGDDLGFALNFQTGEDRWDDRQGIRRAFEDGFRLTG